MPAPIEHITPDESAALTRLALSYCLGKGSICLVSRSFSLQIAHPKSEREYAYYQWRRLCQYLPRTKEPKFHEINDGICKEGSGQWRLRVGSRWFETAWRLLYGTGSFYVDSTVLDLLGVEALAALWADKGRVQLTRNGNFCTGRLNLSRYSWESADAVHTWIRSLTGASGTIHHSPYSADAPMLYYDNEATIVMMRNLSSTWMSQADCLRRKFRLPRRIGPIDSILERERLAAMMQIPKSINRRVPTRKPLKARMPEPPLLPPSIRTDRTSEQSQGDQACESCFAPTAD